MNVTDLPTDILTTIAAKLAADGTEFWATFRLSCTTLSKVGMEQPMLNVLRIGVDSVIPKHVLANLYVARHPKAIYRKAMEYFFVDFKSGESLQHLSLATQLGHIETEYRLYFFKLLNKRESIRDEAVEKLSRILCEVQEAGMVDRNKLLLRLRLVDMNSPQTDEVEVQKFCNPLKSLDYDDFLHRNRVYAFGRYICCKRCSADREIAIMSKFLKSQIPKN